MLRYFDHIIFCKVHSVDPIKLCFNPILISIGTHIDEFREHAKIYVLFDVT